MTFHNSYNSKSKPFIATCLPILFFLVLSYLFCFPLLKELYSSCRGDWDYFFFLYEIPSISLYEYRQFPLWNPYCGGGIPLIGNPQQGFPSPTFIMTSLFGVVGGLKLSIWMHTFLGLWGTWLLGKYMGVQGIARLAPPLIFMFSGPWAFHLTEGHIVWLPAAFMPFVLLAYLKGQESGRWIVGGAFFECLMIYEGGTYVFAYFILFLFVFAVFHLILVQRIVPIRTFLTINLITIGLAAPKLFPMLELLNQHPRIMASDQAPPLYEFISIFTERDNQLGSNTWEYSSYIGLMVTSLYLVSIATVRKHVPLVISSVAILLVAIGDFAPFAPWTLLHLLPIFKNFQQPTRCLIIFCFAVSLLTGLYLTRWIQNKNNLLVSISVSIIVLFVGVDLFLFGKSIFHQATKPVQMSLDKKAELYKIYPNETTGLWRSIPSVHQVFIQTSVPVPERYSHGAWSNQYLSALQNRGVIDAYETLPFDRYARSIDDKEYKGEYYLLHGGRFGLLKWSPNKLIFHVQLTYNDRLVINQNYWPGWHTSRGEIINHKGLLAIDLPLGEYDITINYLPKYFLLGVCLFCITIIGVSIYLVSIRKPSF